MKKLSAFLSPILPILAATVWLTANAASAATLVSYTFEGATPFAPTSSQFVTATDITSVGGALGTTTIAELNLTPPVTGFTSTGTLSTGTAATTKLQKNDSNGSLDTANYFTFTLTPQTGGVDLDSISFDLAKGGDASTRTVTLRYSFDGFTTFTEAGTTTISATYSGVADDYLRTTFSLVDQVPASDLTTSAVEFRFFPVSSGASASTSQTLRFDNIVVAGVPEPSTFGMLLGGLGLLIGFRRTRRS